MPGIKKILSFFVSLRTAIWLLIALICLLLYGSVIMPVHEEFLALHTVALFDWMREMPVSLTWWPGFSWGAFTAYGKHDRLQY